MRQARRCRQVAVFPQATSHRPRAGSKTPTPLSPKGGSFVGCGLQAADVSSPSPHITNHALRTQRADTWVRPYDEMTGATSHNHRPRATSHRPLFRRSSGASHRPASWKVYRSSLRRLRKS